jgi:hypothetical protein
MAVSSEYALDRESRRLIVARARGANRERGSPRRRAPGSGLCPANWQASRTTEPVTPQIQTEIAHFGGAILDG